ncbi:MAG: hypothetical protein ACRD12_10680 [Acidimicrobiales bacterium]
MLESTNALAGGTATSGWFTPAAVGTYRWTAVYSGDANNNPATSHAPDESVVVRPFVPPPCTRTLTGNLAGRSRSAPVRPCASAPRR